MIERTSQDSVPGANLIEPCMQARSPFPLLYICSHADADANADVKGPGRVALLVGAADVGGIGAGAR